MLKIVTLLENSRSQNKALIAEHGLSFYVELNGHRLLLDAGSGSAAVENGGKLNVPFSQVEAVVLSHSHYDHAGGYPWMVQAGVRCPLVTGEYFWEEKYAHDGDKYVYLGCGFNQDWLRQEKIAHRICQQELLLFEGCHVVSHFERNYEAERIPARFVKETAAGMAQDDFADEICLALETPKGIVILAGCSHPGILNMTAAVAKRLQQPIYAVLGGSHLVEAGEERTTATMEELERMGVSLLGLNHCTGDTAEAYLRKNSRLSVFHLGSGDCFFV